MVGNIGINRENIIFNKEVDMKPLQISITNKDSVSFKSKILGTNTMGFGVNTAVKMGDKGFFNALKCLANDGLKRDVVISGSNSTDRNLASAFTILRAGNVEYSRKSIQKTTSGIDGFHLMGENVIELIKKLANDTGNISKEFLSEKAPEDELVRECNAAYKSIFIG